MRSGHWAPAFFKHNNSFVATAPPQPRALCFEWGFMRTFPGNLDVAVK